MDLHHCSRMTQKIKTYMEETLFDEQKQIKPTRLNYLKKLVEDVYYGEYLQYKNLKQPNRKDINEPQKTDKHFFKIFFAGMGYKERNHLEFCRLSETLWNTSEIGIGYTTTCSQKPDWLII